MTKMFIVVKRNEGGFSPAWLLTKEQLFQFFHEKSHSQIDDGLEQMGGGSFQVHTETEAFMVSPPTLPFYMNDNKTIYADGSPVEPNRCITPDHYVTTFTVTIRSMNPVQAESVKDQLQKRYEVTEVEQTDRTTVVREVRKTDL